MKRSEAIRLLESEGYVVLRRKSHEHTLRELDRARNALAFEKTAAEGTRQWALNAFAEERRLRDRLTFVWGVATALGATADELAADPLTPPQVRL